MVEAGGTPGEEGVAAGVDGGAEGPRHPHRLAARETAVAASTASQPSSIAWAASEAVPMPASSISGTLTASRISAMACGLRMPSPLPIGEPSGITAAQPTSSRRRPRTGSSVV